MAELADIAYTLVTSPRIAESPASVDEVTVQDALDTLSEKQAGIDVIGATPSVDNTVFVSGSGKDDLGGGTSVGITSTFDNLQWAFASDYVATQAGSATSIGSETLKDTGAAFVTNGITRGAAIINYDDRSVSEVLTIVSETELTHRLLNNGANNDWTIGDNYTIHNIVQKSIAGGNQVAIDDLGNSISPIFPTAFTQVILTASSSATATSQEALEAGLFGGEVCLDPTFGYAGTGSIGGIPIGTRQAPSNNIADSKQICIARGFRKINIMDSYEILVEDLSAGFAFSGDSPFFVLTLNPAANVSSCSMQLLTIQGEADGLNLVRDCKLLNVENISGILHEVKVSGNISLSGPTELSACSSGFAGETQSTITVGANILQVREFLGSLFLDGISGGTHSVGIKEGRLLINGTGGTVNVRGEPYEIIDLSGGAVEIIDNTLSGEITKIRKMLSNKVVVKADNTRTTIYDDDGVTILHEFTHTDVRNREPV